MDRDSSSAENQGQARRAEERRIVTTLFCDLVGFTAISERNDPELVDAMLRRYYLAARRVVESYGGVVEKYIGDAVVAVFGVPALHEDDPERAVRAGLRLIDEVDALPGIGGTPLEVRVGVNTGEVLVRLDVDPASGEGFLTGDAVNVAARLQSAAPAMAVAVGRATHAATEKIFAFDACHRVGLKGKSQPLEAWIATASLARTGSELRSFSSQFVGRGEELAALQELLAEAADSKQARLALVIGEPGIGKSRLLAEFARRLDDGPGLVTWRQGRCLPFGSNVTFWALSEIVRTSAGILESDGVARSEARLEAVLPQEPDRDRLRARLRPLLGLEAVESSREENFVAWRDFLESLAASVPLVIVIEDLHWADEAMLAFMDFMTESTPEVPLLLLATARPEVLERSGPGAGFVSTTEHVTLGPLSGEETAELARSCLGAKALPTDLHALILERSGGNPLFAEELVRLLEDRGLLESREGRVRLKPDADVPIPDSIGALIAARLDLLSPQRKALLADASVVGRSFWAGAVAAVGGAERAEVFEGLHELVAKELVRPERDSSIEGEAEFCFIHALVCDVAYAQLTRADRAAKHAALARWLEERTAGRTEDLAEVLAYHYGTALDLASSCGLELEDELMEPTSRYLALAGGRAAPLDATAAAGHFARAERVNEHAARPRRWLLSRRTRRTLRRRAPLLVAAAAVIVVAAVAGLAVWAFAASKPPGPAGLSDVPKTMTATEIADTYGPSVVRISAKTQGAAGASVRPKTVTASGVVISKEGLILTSAQPFRNRALGDPLPVFVTVEAFGRQGQYRTSRGVLLGVDRLGNAALVKVEPSEIELDPIPLGDSDSVKKGQSVVTLSRVDTTLAQASGHLYSYDQRLWAFGPQQTKTKQRILVTMRTSASFPIPATGGALVDSHGRLIGVMGDFHGADRGDEQIGSDVAVSINFLRPGIAEIQRNAQQLPSAWFGVSGSSVTPGLARAIGLSGSQGALVELVVPDSPADTAGILGGGRLKTIDGERHILGGDVIVAVGDVRIRSFEDLPRVLRQLSPGETVSIHVLRGGSPVTVRVKLVSNPLRS